MEMRQGGIERAVTQSISIRNQPVNILRANNLLPQPCCVRPLSLDRALVCGAKEVCMSDRFDPSKKERPAHLSAQMLKEQARRLRQKKGWDPRKLAGKDPAQLMRQLDQESANAQVYTQECDACLEERSRAGDDTALCPEHLAQAMGF